MKRLAIRQNCVRCKARSSPLVNVTLIAFANWIGKDAVPVSKVVLVPVAFPVAAAAARENNRVVHREPTRRRRQSRPSIQFLPHAMLLSLTKVRSQRGSIRLDESSVGGSIQTSRPGSLVTRAVAKDKAGRRVNLPRLRKTTRSKIPSGRRAVIDEDRYTALCCGVSASCSLRVDIVFAVLSFVVNRRIASQQESLPFLRLDGFVVP